MNSVGSLRYLKVVGPFVWESICAEARAQKREKHRNTKKQLLLPMCVVVGVVWCVNVIESCVTPFERHIESVNLTQIFSSSEFSLIFRRHFGAIRCHDRKIAEKSS